MTLQQLRYAVAIAEKSSISEAAASLFVAQPSLTKSLHSLEKEMGLMIFRRTSKGIAVTREGEEFLGYARQVIEQADLMEEKYGSLPSGKHRFCVSTQHYSFAVEAFVDLLRDYGGDTYDFRRRETQTYEIIEDVARLKSEVGILYLNHFNETILRKTLRENDLQFHLLFKAKPHVFLGSRNPLAGRPAVTLQDLSPYPRLSFEQGEFNSFYFSEEILSTVYHRKSIHVSDRATLFNLVLGLNGYTICSGVLSTDLNGKQIISRPLATKEKMLIGWIVNSKAILSRNARDYIVHLKEIVKGYGFELLS